MSPNMYNLFLRSINRTRQQGKGYDRTKMKYSEIKELARKIRKNPTAEEKRLWQEIRKRKIDGYGFLRQHPIIYESRDGEYFY